MDKLEAIWRYFSKVSSSGLTIEDRPTFVFGDEFPPELKPRTVSEALEKVLEFSEPTLLTVLNFLRDKKAPFSELQSSSVSFLYDVELLMAQIPEQDRARSLELWDQKYQKFPGFSNLKVLRDWITSCGDTFLLFLLGRIYNR